MLGQQREIIDKRRHRRIKPVTFCQLYRQAFLQAARHDPGRLEPLHARQYGLYLRYGNAQTLCRFGQIRAHISVIISHIDQMRRNQAVRAGQRQIGQLIMQMLAKGLFPAGMGGRVKLLAIKPAAALARARPVHSAAGIARAGHIRRTVGIHRLAVCIERLVGNRRRGRIKAQLAMGIGGLGLGRPLVLAASFNALVALQQRVTLQLFLDELGQLQIVELQQLDGLLELRGS